MTGDEPRSVAGDVYVGSDDTSAVPAHDLHCDACPSLETTADVPAVPCHTQWNLWVYTDGGEHCSCILHARSSTAGQQSEP